eukprot:scaffold145207_cov21-Attheya_sp.AAC.1
MQYIILRVTSERTPSASTKDVGPNYLVPHGIRYQVWHIISQPQRPIGTQQLLAHHDDGPKKWAANATTGTIPLDFFDLSSRGQSKSMSGTVSDSG